MKGFFGYATGLAMILIILYLGINLTNNSTDLEKVKNELIICDQANTERTILENNTDKIIYTKLNEQIILKNYNLQKARNEINSALQNYLNKRSRVMTIFGEDVGEINTYFLNESSSVEIFEAKGIVYAEYTFTSNYLKNQIVGKKLGNEIISYFKIPIGHTTRIISYTLSD